MIRSSRTILFLLFVLLLGGASWKYARAAAEKSREHVLVFGIDAGEWDVLGPLLDQGKCPNFARLRAEGSAGKLRSFVPLTRSPVIWTSIATGKVPDKHGIKDFYAFARRLDPGGDDSIPRGLKPNTSNKWKARSVWNILGGLGRTVGVIGWWVTWPAQPVNGVLVTDYVQYDPKNWTSRSGMTYPESLSTMTERYRRTVQSISWAEIFQFVAPFDTTQVTERQKVLVGNLKWVLASDLTFYQTGIRLYRRNHPDFFAMYFRGVDEICHSYWDVGVPGNLMFSPPPTKAELEWLKPIIPNYYIFTDRMLGDFLKEAGKDTDVIVCSDHGFGGGGGGVMAHKPDGMIFMRGPHVIQGGTITGATVLDITPTILALYGLPTAQDMDGRPIATGLKPDVVKRVARETKFQTYESAHAGGKSEEPLASPVDEELRERLRSLGYIQ
ncbi:MAG TPA: alkaline phosphatase family protein [Candidatus Binatia bacterium]|nr:alkaline phosphatase family protein [Candidatus Binatia bacterium]